MYTRPRWEKKIASLLDSRGIENYLPLNKILKQWSDRKKIVQEPLFKGYIFVNALISITFSLLIYYRLYKFLFRNKMQTKLQAMEC